MTGAGGRARTRKTVQNYSAMGAEDPHKAIRDDVRLLGELLGDVLKRQEGDALFERVEAVRALAKRRRSASSSSTNGFEALTAELAGVPIADALSGRACVRALPQSGECRRAASPSPPPACVSTRSVGEAATWVGRGSAATAGRGLVGGRCVSCGVRAPGRAGLHRASDRDHAPYPAAQVPAHRRDAGRARSCRSHPP